jgi:hypothetical protein
MIKDAVVTSWIGPSASPRPGAQNNLSGFYPS